MTAILPVELNGYRREAAPDPGSAAELAGALPRCARNEDLLRYSLDELEEIARGCHETARDACFMLADVLLEITRRAGDRPSDRARALQEFAGRLLIGPQQARALVRVARTFPPAERERFPGFQWGQFRALAERTRVEGQSAEERQATVLRLAEEAADQGLGTRGTVRLIESELRPDVLPPREEVLRRVSDGLALDFWKHEPGVPLETCGRLAELARSRLARALEGFQVVRP